jgi:hypothetical protein
MERQNILTVHQIYSAAHYFSECSFDLLISYQTANFPTSYKVLMATGYLCLLALWQHMEAQCSASLLLE